MLAMYVYFGRYYVVCVHGKENPLDSSISSQASIVLFVLETASAWQRSLRFQAVINSLPNLCASLVV